MSVLAVDAGGTIIKVGLVQNGVVRARATIEARSHEGLAPQLPRIAQALRGIATSDVIGIGMAFPSLVDVETGGVTRDSGKYRDAMGLDLNQWATHEFGVPFSIENDARMATIGEWRCGAARDWNNVVMMTLGTGIGTGVVLKGQILRGTHGQAGCLGGHTIVNVEGRVCPCGARGCAEAEASTAVLPSLACEDPEFCSSLLRNSNPLDYAKVFAACEQGDAVAKRLLKRSLNVWGALAVSLVHAYDPEVLVLGGGVLAAGEKILQPIRERLDRDAWMPTRKVEVVRSKLGDDAALLACEWLVKSRSPGIPLPA